MCCSRDCSQVSCSGQQHQGSLFCKNCCSSITTGRASATYTTGVQDSFSLSLSLSLSLSFIHTHRHPRLSLSLTHTHTHTHMPTREQGKVQAKKASGFFSAQSFVDGFTNNALGVVGFVNEGIKEEVCSASMLPIVQCVAVCCSL